MNQRFPLDTNHPIGYLNALFSEFVGVVCILNLNACASTYPLGIFLFGLAMIKDIKRSLRFTNEKTNTNGNQTEIFVELCESIQFQSILRQLSILYILTYYIVKTSEYVSE